MLKPWELDWSGGSDPASPNLPPIAPFFGGLRPPMLEENGQAFAPQPTSAGGSYPIPTTDPSAIQPPGPFPSATANARAMARISAQPVGSFDPSAAAFSALATGGTSAGAASDALAFPSMARPQAFGPDAVAQQPSGPPEAHYANAFPQPQLPQPSAVASPSIQDLMPQAGPRAQSLLQPAVYGGWSGTSPPPPSRTSPSQADPAPAHVTVAQARSTLQRPVRDVVPWNALMHGTGAHREDGAAQQQHEQRTPVPGLIIPLPFIPHGVVNRPLWFYRIEHEGEGSGQKQVSKKGAVSVMQIMPGTAPEAARLAGLPLDREKLRREPDYARSLGYAYLDSLLKRFDGNVVLATAAYNGGAHNVAKWIRQYGDPRAGDITDYEFAQHIPFDQTKEYVGRVVYGETRAEQDQRRKQKQKLEPQQRQAQPRRRPPPLIGQPR